MQAEYAGAIAKSGLAKAAAEKGIMSMIDTGGVKKFTRQGSPENT